MSAYETADDDRTEKESSPYAASIDSRFSRDATPTGDFDNTTPRESTPFEDTYSETTEPLPVTHLLAKGDHYSVRSEFDQQGKTILMRFGTAIVVNMLESVVGVIWG